MLHYYVSKTLTRCKVLVSHEINALQYIMNQLSQLELFVTKITNVWVCFCKMCQLFFYFFCMASAVYTALYRIRM